jgi:putative ATP-binding cassette transporter
MGGLWKEGHGAVKLPAKRAFFLPQKPYLPIGTLREALSYPQAPEVYPAERFAQVLETCRLGHLIPRLDESEHWQRMLSPGEQQRVAFARALLFAPDWLHLDEATSVMDEEDEAALYQALLDELPGVTLLSIGHRSSLKRFHGRHVRIDGGQLHDVSYVRATYGIASRSLGSVALLGPLRMDYDKAIRAVRAAAFELSRLVEDVYEDD